MDGLINFTGSLSGEIEEGGGSGVTPHVTATASVNDQTGVPGVTVVRSGTDAAPNFDFNFVNLKGENGAPGAPGPQGLTGPTGPAGAQGPRGFTGATGATGPAGADGYSPAVSVTDIPGGHRVTITDETHPLGISFDVMDGVDGTDGQDGSPGPQGPQGQPGAGVPEGGAVGQILTKASAVDYDTEWMDNEASAVDYDNTQSGLAADNMQAAVDEINASLTQWETINFTGTFQGQLFGRYNPATKIAIVSYNSVTASSSYSNIKMSVKSAVDGFGVLRSGYLGVYANSDDLNINNSATYSVGQVVFMIV